MADTAPITMRRVLPPNLYWKTHDRAPDARARKPKPGTLASNQIRSTSPLPRVKLVMLAAVRFIPGLRCGWGTTGAFPCGILVRYRAAVILQAYAWLLNLSTV